MSKILGVDIGKKRIGLAISDEEGKIAFPLEVIEVEEEQEILDKIKEIIRREGIELIVIGIPYSLKGTITPSTEFALLVAEKFREEGFKVKEIDERLTTKEAMKLTSGKKKRKGNIDKISATLLLQTYLERKEKNEEWG